MSTFYIQQFGCRATQADGAAIERQLLDRGLTPASDAAAAGVVVVNTCTVTAAADSQARDAIRKIHSQNPAAKVIVTGCYAQRAPEELATLPGVSWVLGNSHKPQIPDLVTQIAPAAEKSPPVGAQHVAPQLAPSAAEGAVIPSLPAQAGEARPARRGGKLLFHSSHSAQILASDIFAQSAFLSAPVLGGESGHTRPTLKIQDGCNLRCAYCVIPFVRGKSRSLPPDAVIGEVLALTSPNSTHPAREIVLSGINLGTYGRDLSPRVAFEDLLRRILDETSLDRLRISSIEPLDVTADLVELFASTDRIAQHFHMPLQSASDRILAAMHRWYRAEHYARRVELIHDRLPHAAIGADVITGFPGESETDHAATLSFVDRLAFTYLHVFSFSARPGTQAATLPNQVPSPIIKRRARELRALGEAKSASFRRSQLGRTLRVLTLRRDENEDTSTTPALSSNYLRTRIPANLPANVFLDVLISGEEGNYLSAEPTTICEQSPLCAR
jgi:threonylcarbamoyladenosine tRNA methylthiotransferase MtaB